MNLYSQTKIGSVNQKLTDQVNESLNSMPLSETEDVKEVSTLKFYFEVEILNGGFEDDITIGCVIKTSRVD